MYVSACACVCACVYVCMCVVTRDHRLEEKKKKQNEAPWKEGNCLRRVHSTSEDKTKHLARSAVGSKRLGNKTMRGTNNNIFSTLVQIAFRWD